MPRRVVLVAVASLAALSLGGCGARRPSESQLLRDGRQVFVSAGCGGCHTAASARTHGQVGPDFDTSEPLSRKQIRTEVDFGAGVMPAYRDRLSAGQRDAVIEFVFQTLHQRR